MEAVSYVAGEPWSDNPACACPVISELLRTWNDDLPTDADRDRLLRPLIPRLVGSRSTPEVEARRSWLAMDWLVRTHAPAWLRLVPALVPHAAALTDLPPIMDAQTATAHQSTFNAADVAAWDAAGDAADVAAMTAAGAAARVTAWDAAGDAAVDAAMEDAARAAARAAMEDAARAALQPTVATLQRSALLPSDGRSRWPCICAIATVQGIDRHPIPGRSGPVKPPTSLGIPWVLMAPWSGQREATSEDEE